MVLPVLLLTLLLFLGSVFTILLTFLLLEIHRRQLRHNDQDSQIGFQDYGGGGGDQGS